MNQIFYNGKYTNVPHNWDSLSGKQYVACINTLLLLPGTLEEKNLRLLKILTGWGWWKIAFMLKWFSWNPLKLIGKKIASFRKKEYEDFGKVLNRTYALAEASDSLTAFLHTGIDISKNIIPYIRKTGRVSKLKAKCYAGPADELANMRMSEFVYAEHYFQNWRNTKSPADLNYLVAVIYRPVVTAYRRQVEDPRTPFNVHACTHRAKVVNNWPLPLRMAIAEMYGSLRNKKIEENPRVFNDGNEGGESLYGLWSVMRQVAKQGHFGKFADIEETYVDTVLMELNESLAEADRLEEELENNKN